MAAMQHFFMASVVKFPVALRVLELVRTEKQIAAADSASHTRFLKDERDTASPDAMTALLAKFERGEALKPVSTELLRDLMERSATGPNRLKGQLPAGTVVAHKTGTWGDAAMNDVGIITLPGGKGHVAIAVFTNRTKAGVDPEQTIAEM